MIELLMQQVESLEARAEECDRLRQLLAQEVRELTAGLEGSARMFENAWLDCVRAVAGGEGARVHADRERFVAAFERRRAVLRRARELAIKAGGAGLAAIDLELAGLKQFEGRVFEPWKTSGDLEVLAARDSALAQAKS